MSAITHTYRFSGSGEDFGPRADGIVTLHTTESVATRNTVADAKVIAAWQDRPDILGSYNRLICIDGVLSCVPDNHASGGINPGSSGFKPLAWLYDVLMPEAVRNPNYFTLNLSAVGSKAYFDANGWPPGIIDGFARSIIDEEQRIGRKVVLTNHADFQPPPNRSDAGPIATALVKKRYAELTETDMPTPALHYVPQLWTANAPGAELREQADTSAPVVATVPAGGVIFTVGEAQGDRVGWRVAVAGDPERLYYVRRAQITALPPTPRDPALHQGIAAVVNARAAGKPAPGGITPEQLAQAKRVAFGRGRDVGIAAYTAAGTAAAKAVPYQET